jgi:hypothetical protein
MHTSQNTTSKKSSQSAWVAAGALMLAAALAITFAVRGAPTHATVTPSSRAQNVLAAAANQRELDYLRALGANIP